LHFDCHVWFVSACRGPRKSIPTGSVSRRAKAACYPTRQRVLGNAHLTNTGLNACRSASFSTGR
jgi:hypothetical protein